VAGRQGVSRIVFRLFAAVGYLLLTLSNSARSPIAIFSSAFFRLPAFADFAGAMSLKMSLAACVSFDCLSKNASKFFAKPYGVFPIESYRLSRVTRPNQTRAVMITRRAD
jgi:hypothetical protein